MEQFSKWRQQQTGKARLLVVVGELVAFALLYKYLLKPLLTLVGRQPWVQAMFRWGWPKPISDGRLVLNMCLVFAFIAAFAVVFYNLNQTGQTRKQNS